MTELHNFTEKFKQVALLSGPASGILAKINWTELPLENSRIVGEPKFPHSWIRFELHNIHNAVKVMYKVLNDKFNNDRPSKKFEFVGTTDEEKYASFGKMIKSIHRMLQRHINETLGIKSKEKKPKKVTQVAPKEEEVKPEEAKLEKKEEEAKPEEKLPGKEEVAKPEAKLEKKEEVAKPEAKPEAKARSAASSSKTDEEFDFSSDEEESGIDYLDYIVEGFPQGSKKYVSVTDVAEVVARVDRAYIPLDTDIRDLLRSERVIKDYLKNGERIVQIFYNPSGSSESLNFDVYILGVDGEAITRGTKIELSINKDDLGLHFTTDDIAKAIRKVLGSKPIMSHVRAIERSRIAPTLDRRKALADYKKMKAMK